MSETWSIRMEQLSVLNADEDSTFSDGDEPYLVAIGFRSRFQTPGSTQVWATVWDWNTASRRVLAKLGFTETERRDVDATHGTALFAVKRL